VARRGADRYGSRVRIALVLVALAACGGGDDYEKTTGGGPGGGMTTGGADARTDAVSDGALGDGPMLAGRVCLVTDLRVLDGCATTGAGGLAVTLGTATATTADDGTFAIAAQSGTGLVWHASGGTIATSVMPVTAVQVIPAIDATAYGQLVVGQTGAAFVPGRGSLVARVIGSDGTAVAGASAVDTPPGIDAVLYDGASATSWQELSTGAQGVVWIPHAADGANTLAVTPATGDPASVTATVEDVSITFVTVAL
jgi:hypothetical protein